MMFGDRGHGDGDRTYGQRVSIENGYGSMELDPGVTCYGSILHPHGGTGTGSIGGAYGRHRVGTPEEGREVRGRVWGNGTGHLGRGGMSWYFFMWSNEMNIVQMLAWERGDRALNAGILECEIALELIADPWLKIYESLPEAWTDA